MTFSEQISENKYHTKDSHAELSQWARFNEMCCKKMLCFLSLIMCMAQNASAYNNTC